MPSSSESAKMVSYKLSQAADEDFENIFDYGIDTFGLEQAVIYQTGMKMRFDEMAENPMFYNAVDHIKQGYRRSVFTRVNTRALLSPMRRAASSRYAS